MCTPARRDRLSSATPLLSAWAQAIARAGPANTARTPSPSDFTTRPPKFLQHLGLYAYRRQTLLELAALPNANHLIEVEEIMKISSRLVVNQAALKLKREPIRQLIDSFANAIAP